MPPNTYQHEKRLSGVAQVNGTIWSICDIMRRSKCAGAMQYVPELTWILFLRILDDREDLEGERARALGIPFTSSIEPPYRWRDWAAPRGLKRTELDSGALGGVMDFANNELIPYLRSLGDKPDATPRRKIISRIMSSVERVRIDTERNFLDVIDRVDRISDDNTDRTHVFLLSQVYEGLLLRMGEKNNDGGQFFTPREVIRAMVRAVDPKVGETVYDPCCGTGGFLAQSFEHMSREAETGEQIDILKHNTFYGREKEDLVYPIALANLVLHGIDQPNLWHGNTLTGQETYGGLFEGAPELFDVILTNPPFGGKEGSEARTQFAYKTGSTQVLFLQHVIDSLKPGGRCGIVLDEGVLFRNNEKAFVKTKQKLLEECDLWSIVSLPPGTFVNAGAGVKASLLFFTKGESTRSIRYYDLSDVKVGKKSPLTVDKFDGFFEPSSEGPDRERTWTATRAEIEEANYDLKAVNPHTKPPPDPRTPEELLDLIEVEGRAVAEAVAALRRLTKPRGPR